MRPLLLALASAAVLASACYHPTDVFSTGSGCIPPEDPSSPRAGSLPALVDRADVIALVTVARAEHRYPQYEDGLGAGHLTLRRVDVAKGAAPAEFVVDDGPCPMLAARDGESLIVLLEATPDGAALKPIGFPRSVLRATPGRSLTQLMDGVRSITPLDADARALFERNGWTVTAKQDVGEFDLPPASEFRSSAREIVGAAPYLMNRPLDTYAALSTEVGLDLRAAAGRRGGRPSFWLERRPPEYAEGTPFGHVLIADRRLVGAWVTVFPEGGPYALTERAAALAAPPTRPPFPPSNRFPEGVNIARTYELGSALSIAYKTSSGGNGEITDAARIHALAAALDETLPTTQAAPSSPSAATPYYYLHFFFGGSQVSLEYDATSGVLSVPADGFSVHPGPDFAALAATIEQR